MDAVHAFAVERNASRIWLITTNDNGRAISASTSVGDWTSAG